MGEEEELPNDSIWEEATGGGRGEEGAIAESPSLMPISFWNDSLMHSFSSILHHQNGSQHDGEEHNNQMAKGNHHRHYFLIILLANLMFGIILLFCFFVCSQRLKKANNNADGAENGDGSKLCHLQNPISMRNLEEQIASHQEQQAAAAEENPYEIV
jgi:hypothetical protein